MHEKDRILQCLLRLNAFETAFAYYSLSNGGLHSASTRQAADALVESLVNLSKDGLATLDSAALGLARNADPVALLADLKEWGKGDAEAASRLSEKQVSPLLTFFAALKREMHARLGLDVPVAGPDGSEMMYRVSFTRWQGHFPTTILMSLSDAEEILHQASLSETIVVMADIRRSQDLMTHATDQGYFASHMVRFIQESRNLLDENLGIFDKFTGDGFLAYFNKAVCERFGEDFRECFLNFSRSEIAFAEKHFAEWRSTVRRLPDKVIGLAIGADIGRVTFEDIDSHFMAVGDAIVWADRMAASGKAGEVVVNNLLYHKIKNRPELELSQLTSATKTGESFLAWKATFPA